MAGTLVFSPSGVLEVETRRSVYAIRAGMLDFEGARRSSWAESIARRGWKGSSYWGDGW